MASSAFAADEYEKIANSNGLYFLIGSAITSETSGYLIYREKPEDLKKDNQIRKQVVELLIDQWKKDLQKNFTPKEIEYLKTLYSHPLLNKLQAFNVNFSKSENVKRVIVEKYHDKFPRVLQKQKK